MKTTLVPYLNFDGTTTADAMKFYQGIFDGEPTMQTFGEAGMAQKDEEKDYIIHALLQTPDFTFMASSGIPGQAVKFGDSVSMSLVGEDREKLKEWFENLPKAEK